MRDKERIPEICLLVQKIWSNHSELRFFQLISNLCNEYSNGETSDLFYLEDDKFLDFLYSKLNEGDETD